MANRLLIVITTLFALLATGEVSAQGNAGSVRLFGGQSYKVWRNGTHIGDIDATANGAAYEYTTVNEETPAATATVQGTSNVYEQISGSGTEEVIFYEDATWKKYRDGDIIDSGTYTVD